VTVSDPAPVFIDEGGVACADAPVLSTPGHDCECVSDGCCDCAAGAAEVDHAGRAVYRFTGMGRVHLIWFSNDLVWWVSADPGDEAAFLDGFCR